MIRQASRLQWIQALTAGVDFFPLTAIKEKGIMLTNGRGIHKIYIAEYAIAAMRSRVDFRSRKLAEVSSTLAQLAEEADFKKEKKFYLKFFKNISDSLEAAQKRAVTESQVDGDNIQ